MTSLKGKWSATIVLVLGAVIVAGCGGGDTESPTGPSTQRGQIYYPSGETPPLNQGGIVLYPGQQPVQPPLTPPSPPPVGPAPPGQPEGGYGAQVFPMIVDSQGNGAVTIKNFSPGQQLALISINLNREFLDFQPPAGTQRGWLPETSYSVSFNFVDRSVSSTTPRKIIDLSNPSDAVNLLDTRNYRGLPYRKNRLTLEDLRKWAHEDWVSNGGFDTRAPLKTASLLSKGEIRTFTEIPRTIPLPPIVQGQEQRNLEELRWPDPYYGQDGRLVAIGSKCYVFLTTEINSGFPDGIRFTEARLNRFALEFDTNIYPLITEGMAPVRGTRNEGPGPNEGPIWKNLDRSITLTTDDFDQEGNLQRRLPGEPDTAIGRDQRIIIAILNLGAFGAAGLYQNWQRGIFRPEQEEGREEESYAWSTLYLDPSIFPANSDDWSQPYAVLAHEFQHKIYADAGLGPSVWLNEGLSQVAIYLAGYTLQSGRTADILVQQITEFLNSTNVTPVPLDGEKFRDVSISASYGGRFLFFLYLYEHYGPSAIRKIYTVGGANPVDIIENATGEKFDVIFSRWAIANLVDGLMIAPDSPLSETIEDNDPFSGNPWVHYLTFDVRGTIGGNETFKLPGVPILWLPTERDVFPVTRTQIPLRPWCSHYVVITNGDGRDLDLTVLSDPNFRLFILPVTFDKQNNTGKIEPGVYIPRS